MDHVNRTREETGEDSSGLIASETARGEKSSSAAGSEAVIEMRSMESRCGNGKSLDSAEIKENSLDPVASDDVGNGKASCPDSLEAVDEMDCVVESRYSANLAISGTSKKSEKLSIPVVSETVIEVRLIASAGCGTGKELDLAEAGDNSSDRAASVAAGNANSSNSVGSETLHEIRCADSRCLDGKDDDLGGNIGNSSNSVAQETVIEVRCAEAVRNAGKNRATKAKADDVLDGKKIAVDKMKAEVPDPVRGDCIVLDVRGGDGGLDSGHCNGDKVCRICHLNFDRGLNASDMFQLGCDCKEELGIAHRHCAETWFKLKGNRWCEICGQSAKNVTGVGDSRFMEMWNNRVIAGIGSSNLSERGRYHRCQPFGNFLLACLVIAFILPWFFRVNMF